MRFFLGVILYVSIYINNIFFHGTDKKMIIGVWQFGCVEVNTGYFDTYQFFENGTFKFNTNENDETRRIISIGWDNRTNTPLFVGMKLIPSRQRMINDE